MHQAKRCVKEVTVGGRIIIALIDTGSDISMMYASEYALVGSSGLRASKIEFRGIGDYRAATLGRFEAKVIVDRNLYAMSVHVVSDAMLHYDLLIGTDFLNSVEINVKRDVISIKPIREQTAEERSEIFAIDAVQCADEIDVAYIKNVDYRRALTNLITNYKPNKVREMDIRMTII